MKMIDSKLFKFIGVGVLNTLVGYAINFSCLNFFHMGVWPSSAANYILTSIMSFFLNKYFTFKSSGNLKKEAVKFAVNIIICYVLAYGIAIPLTKLVMGFASEEVFGFINNITFNFFKTNQDIIDNIATLVGMVLFVAFNYTGQRFFAFKNEE